MSATPRVLLVDDEPLMRIPLSDRLRSAGYDVTAASTGEEALEALLSTTFDVAVIDLKLPGIDGLEVLRRIRERGWDTDAVVITAHGTIGAAVEAMKLGARDFLTKPFKSASLVQLVDRYVRVRQARLQPSCESASTHGMVGRSPQIQRVFRLIEAVAGTPATIIIQGETGTGKELVAHAIHANSSRRNQPMIRVNCAAVPETLVESELFGVERGAFTGADRTRKGRFELADKGTLFLDEVDEMPLLPQAKVLRAIQEGEFERLGGTETVRVDVRLIAATKTDLRQKVDAGKFREDLYYRLNVLPIMVPPLRERTGDVLELAQHFAFTMASEQGRPVPRFSPATTAWLQGHAFPGNVRELKNLTTRAVALCKGDTIELEHLGIDTAAAPAGGPLALARRDFEDRRIQEALDASGGNKSQAAQKLGISRKTLWEKLNRKSRRG